MSITAEQEYAAAYQRGRDGLDYRAPWNAAHRLASREGYTEGRNARMYEEGQRRWTPETARMTKGGTFGT